MSLRDLEYVNLVTMAGLSSHSGVARTNVALHLRRPSGDISPSALYLPLRRYATPRGRVTSSSDGCMYAYIERGRERDYLRN